MIRRRVFIVDDDADLRKTLLEQLAHVEWVRRFVLLDRDFSQEHGEMTPSMKVRRKEIEKKYADLLEYVYNPSGGMPPEHANRVLNVD